MWDFISDLIICDMDFGAQKWRLAYIDTRKTAGHTWCKTVSFLHPGRMDTCRVAGQSMCFEALLRRRWGIGTQGAPPPIGLWVQPLDFKAANRLSARRLQDVSPMAAAAAGHIGALCHFVGFLGGARARTGRVAGACYTSRVL